MNYTRILLRMAKLARHPPSMKQVMIVVVVIAICLALFGLEYFELLPDCMQLERAPRKLPRF